MQLRRALLALHFTEILESIFTKSNSKNQMLLAIVKIMQNFILNANNNNNNNNK